MQQRIAEPLLLVGSIPGDTAAEVMNQWGGGLGKRLAAVPDGEIGERSAWITFLAYRTFHPNPAMETVQRPLPYSPEDPREWRSPDRDWIRSITRISGCQNKGRRHKPFTSIPWVMRRSDRLLCNFQAVCALTA